MLWQAVSWLSPPMTSLLKDFLSLAWFLFKHPPTTSCSTRLFSSSPASYGLLVTWSFWYSHFPLFQISSLNHLISLPFHPIHKLNIHSLTRYNRHIQPSVYLACFLCCILSSSVIPNTCTYSPFFTFLASPSSFLLFFLSPVTMNQFYLLHQSL